MGEPRYSGFGTRHAMQREILSLQEAPAEAGVARDEALIREAQSVLQLREAERERDNEIMLRLERNQGPDGPPGASAAPAVTKGAGLVGSAINRARPEPREGMVTVYDHREHYLGCMGRELWERLLREPVDAHDGTPA